MAVMKIPQTSTLSIKVQTGLNLAGNPIYKTISYSSVKPAAADADVHAVGVALGALQEYPAIHYIRVESGALVDQ